MNKRALRSIGSRRRIGSVLSRNGRVASYLAKCAEDAYGVERAHCVGLINVPEMKAGSAITAAILTLIKVLLCVKIQYVSVNRSMKYETIETATT